MGIYNERVMIFMYCAKRMSSFIERVRFVGPCQHSGNIFWACHGFGQHCRETGKIYAAPHGFEEPCQNSRKIYWARHGFKGLVHSRGRSLAVRKKTDTCDQEHRTFSATAQQTCYYYFLIPLESQLQSYIISTTKHILNWITDTDWIVTKLHSFII